MLLDYWNEIQFLSHALAIVLVSLAIVICWAISLSNFSHYYRNGKKLELQSISIQIIVLSILTVGLMILNNSLAKEGFHQNTKVKSILDKYWNERDSYPHFWNDMQSTYKCCGLNGSEDWGAVTPKSCYQTQSTWVIWKKTVTCPYVHERGCYSAFVTYLEEMTSSYKFVGFTFVSLGVFGIVGLLLTAFAYLVFRDKKSPTNLQI